MTLPIERQRSAEEQQLIELLTRTTGRELSEQEIELALEQARALGELRFRTAMALMGIAVLALLHAPAHAQPRPFVNQGGCPSGYYLSGGFCTPTNKDSRPAVPRPSGASCPSGYYTSGGACVKLNR